MALRVRDPKLFLASLLFSSAHPHARILRTSAVDDTIFFLRNPDLHHGLLAGRKRVDASMRGRGRANDFRTGRSSNGEQEYDEAGVARQVASQFHHR